MMANTCTWQQTNFDLIAWASEWKPCRYCKYANGGTCSLCFGRGGYFVLRLRQVAGGEGVQP